MTAEPPQKADMIVVLGGDWTGRRILKAAQLVQQGYAPKILVSGANGFFGYHESTLSIRFATTHGYPENIFVPLTFPALSTQDEAENDIATLRKLGVHKYLLVTNTWHTARAGRIFRRLAPDLEMHPVGSWDRFWDNGYWWKNREGRKIWFTEETKTIAGFLGI